MSHILSEIRDGRIFFFADFNYWDHQLQDQNSASYKRSDKHYRPTFGLKNHSLMLIRYFTCASVLWSYLVFIHFIYPQNWTISRGISWNSNRQPTASDIILFGNRFKPNWLCGACFDRCDVSRHSNKTIEDWVRLFEIFIF